MRHYEPIDCGLHSNYEVAILHRERLRLNWRDERGAAHMETLRPVDLRTERDKGEYLVAERSDGRQERIRLDKIKEAELVRTGRRLTP